MSDVKDLLDRRAGRVQARQGLLTDVLLRVEGRRRRRRLTSGAVALLVAAAGTTMVFVAFGSGLREAQPASQASWEGYWPQDSEKDAEAAQAAADAGDPAYTWQLDGKAVLGRFATQHLGWQTMYFIDVQNSEEVSGELGRLDPESVFDDAEGSGPFRFLISECNPEGSGPVGCPGAYVSIERLLREDSTGIWTVTGADRTSLGFPTATGG
jgi:hypothetical protein